MLLKKLGVYNEPIAIIHVPKIDGCPNSSPCANKLGQNLSHKVCHNRTRDTVYSIIQIAAILPFIHRATREPKLAFARVLSSTHMM